MSTYSEKLRDPRWQKKRLEILARDDWACQICFDTTSTLNVHHRYYNSGLEPWDYQSNALVTLCESCHEDEGEQKSGTEQDLIKILRGAGAFNSQLHDLAAVFTDVNLNEYDWSVLTLHLKRILEDCGNNGPIWGNLAQSATKEWHKKAQEIAKA